MSTKKNVILVDWIPKKDWNFKILISKYTNVEWEVVAYKANGAQNNFFKKLFNTYLKQLYFSFKIFIKRENYNTLIAWQQFFGLIFAFYCELFKVKKYPKLIIMTFIYKPKKGFIGKVYYKFMKQCLASKYIDKVICFSKIEVEYYSKLFDIEKSKFEFCLYGIEKENDKNNESMQQYFLSAGRSNRDYEFLINSLHDSKYEIKIICDTLENKKIGNVEILNNVYGEKYLTYLKKCMAVVISLDDENISSGQLVFLKAMELGKPIVITRSNAIEGYILDNYNAFIINKNKNELLDTLELLTTNKSEYDRISENAKQYFEEYLTYDKFVKSIAEIFENLK